MIETLGIFSEADASDLIRNYPDVCPEFTQLYTESISHLKEMYDKGAVCNSWGEDYSEQAKHVLELAWKKTNNNVTGYEISYSTSKDFSSGVKTIKIEDRNSTSATIKNLKNKTRYYVRMRTYTKTSGSNYDYYTYGAWSGVKNVTTG